MKVTKYLCDRCRRPIAEDEVCEIRDYQHIDIIHPDRSCSAYNSARNARRRCSRP